MSTISVSPDRTYVITSAAPRPTAVRLTRRGRMVVLFAGLLLALLVGFFLGGGSVASPDSALSGTEVVTIAPGDTLWDIAAEINTDGDVHATMRQIEELNALDSAALAVGQKLRVPLAG